MVKVSRDINHKTITDEFIRLGCTVIDLAMVGEGCPDILVGLPIKNGKINLLIEIKYYTGTIKPIQYKFIKDWKGQTGVVRTLLDVRAIVDYYKQSELKLTPKKN